MRSPRPTCSAPSAAGRRAARRWLLGALVTIGCALWLGVGCSASFDPTSLVNSMRVFAVVQDRCTNNGTWDGTREECLPNDDGVQEPDGGETRIVGGSYARPGDQVRMRMTYRDGYVDPDDPDAGPRNVNIFWLGGCFNPEGDQYFNCYDALADVLAPLAETADPAQLIQDILSGAYPNLGTSDQFVLQIPSTVLADRPVPTSGPRYGLGYVFFVVCAGEIRPVPPEGSGQAGSFPVGCFDPGTGQRLGPESFIPGYTQVYIFEDPTLQNEHPGITDILIDGALVSDEALENGVPKPRTRVQRCPVLEDDRRIQGCAAEDVESQCEIYDLSVAIPAGWAAEIDPGAETLDGEQLTEAVWVDYYADGGDIGAPVKLVNDAVEGFNEELETEWTPPSEPGDYFVWAVVHDARGGASVIERLITVE